VALLAAAQGSAWVHAVAVAHVTCLAHGESIHASLPAAGRAPAAQGADGVAADDEAAEGHEHCASGALLRWRDIVLTALLDTVPAPTVAPPAPRPGAFELPISADVYDVAPKTSPPSAGV
jgi:hypothetical protein